MKNSIVIVLSVLLFAVFISFGAGNGIEFPPYAGPEEFLGSSLRLSGPDGEVCSTLPAFLLFIEDEAFESTALRFLTLPDGLAAVGERAFANVRFLKNVCIPGSVSYINDSAFENDVGLVITGRSGSYAENWAKRSGFDFIIIPDAANVPGVLSEKDKDLVSRGAFALLLAAFALLMLLDKNRTSHERRVGEGRTMRPRERAELHHICCRFP